MRTAIAGMLLFIVGLAIPITLLFIENTFFPEQISTITSLYSEKIVTVTATSIKLKTISYVSTARITFVEVKPYTVTQSINYFLVLRELPKTSTTIKMTRIVGIIPEHLVASREYSYVEVLPCTLITSTLPNKLLSCIIVVSASTYRVLVVVSGIIPYEVSDVKVYAFPFPFGWNGREWTISYEEKMCLVRMSSIAPYSYEYRLVRNYDYNSTTIEITLTFYGKIFGVYLLEIDFGLHRIEIRFTTPDYREPRGSPPPDLQRLAKSCGYSIP